MLAVDISYSQTTNIDFVSMRKSVDVVIMKAGGSNTGSRYVDSKYRWFEPRARAAGMQIGHYWFNGFGDPVADANFFVANLSGYKPGDFLALDCESEGDMPYWGPGKANAFCQRVKELTGVMPSVYMSSSVTRAQNWSSTVALGIGLWVAQYGSNNGAMQGKPNISYWPTYKIWQFTSQGSVPGYSGRLDLNIVNESLWTKAEAPPVKKKRKKSMVGTLMWDNKSQGYFMAPGGGWVRVVSNDDYKLLYRAINADQEKSPFVNNSFPESLNALQLDTIRSFVTRSVAMTATVLSDSQIASLGASISSKLLSLGTIGGGLTAQQVADAVAQGVKSLTFGAK